jgi:hypothetical protein
MTWAPQELQKTLWTELTSDPVLMGLVTGVYDSAYVPQDEAFPYVTIGDATFTDRSSHTHRGFEAELTIHVWDQSDNRGRKKVQEIQAEIDRLLHTVNICIDGWNIINFRQIFVEVIVDADNVTMHGIQRFNLMIGEA